jgi:hypothetical protein
MTHSRKLVATLASCVAASAALAGQAWGGKIFHETFHDEGAVVFEDLCGVEGLTVRDEFVLDGKVRAVSRGRDSLPYFAEHLKETELITNPDKGKTVSQVTTTNGKDLKTTDNGDGTTTTLLMATGNQVVYGADGKAIARNPGQIRLVLLIDNGGTPSDPFDDEVISVSPPVKGSTGRSDDICAALVGALT